MKRKLLTCLLVAMCLFVISGCGSKESLNDNSNKKNETVESVVANTKVGYLGFYVPEDYAYRPDLRGLIYNENEKKVYMKGDYENDPDNVISIVVYVSNKGMGAKQYTDEINNNLSSADVKYEIKSNGKIVELYAREKYVIDNNVNYAYIVDKAGYIHVVNIKGPVDKAAEIEKMIKDVFLSLTFDD